MSKRRLNRRQFLQRSSLIALAPTIPAFLSRTAHATAANQRGRILVIIQLSGGNDGINTVVPFADEGYAKNRKHLRIAEQQVCKVNDQVGLHPALRPAADLLQDGRLAIVQGVGYPNPNRSHDVSMAIWHTGRFDPAEHNTVGWIGRAMDGVTLPADGSPHSLLLGSENPPVALRGRQSRSAALADLDDLKLAADAKLFSTPPEADDDDLLAFTRRVALEATSTADLIQQVAISTSGGAPPYPRTELAARLQSIAQLIKADLSTSVYYAIQSGYDTHAAQMQTHSDLLRELAGAMKAFLDDLQTAGLADRVLTVCFSEFGRRVKENGSLGTDHGTAGPVLIGGSAIKPGLVGQSPSLTDLHQNDLKVQIDFRQIYATLLEDWLGIPSVSVLGGPFERLKLVAAT